MSSSETVLTVINQFITASAIENGNVDQPAKSIALMMADGKLSLLQFIQALGPTLTSDDTATRTHSLHCLSATLEALADSVRLSSQDVNILLQFLVNKLEDERLVLHVLSALCSLVKFSKFLPHVNDNFKTLASSLISAYQPRKHLARVRYQAFRLLEQLFNSHKVSLASNPDYANLFTDAFIHIASGEKDPRNLLSSFRLNSAINDAFTFNDRSTDSKHDQLLTDLFDVCFCYFPISFSPPPNDPYKISANDLKLELRSTISSQKQFAQDTFPSLFEKLTSTNPTVRNDVLQTLLLCVEKYDEPTIQQYWASIWDALKFEILHNDVLVFKPESSEIIPPNVLEIEDSDNTKSLFLTLSCVAAIVVKLSPLDDIIDAVAKTIIDDLKPNLHSLESRALKQSVVLLSSVGCVNRRVLDAVITYLFSFEAWGKYIRSDADEEYKKVAGTDETEGEVDVALTIERQRDLIDNLGFIFTASKLLNSPNKLLDYKDHLLIFFGQLLQTSSQIERTLRCKIIQQIVKLISLKNFMSRSELELVLTWLSENLDGIIQSGNQDWNKDIVLNQIINGLVNVMTETQDDEHFHERVSCIKELVLPILLKNTDDGKVLGLINRICVNYEFLDTLSIRLLNKMLYDDCTTEQLCSILNCLIASFNQTQKVKPFLTTSWYKTFVPRFLSVLVKKSNDDFVILELGGQLLGLVVRYIDKPKHQGIFDDLSDVFLNGKPVEGVSVCKCLDATTPRALLYKYLLAKVDKSVTMEGDVQVVLEKCIDMVKSSTSDFIRVTYLEILCLFVNKFTEANGSECKELLERSFKDIETNVENLEVGIWIIKGLIVRLDKLGVEYLQHVLELLFTTSNATVSKAVSASFIIIMSDLEIFKNSENAKGKVISGVTNLQVRFLYKQQVFEIVLKKLLAEYHNNTPDKTEIELSLLAVMINSVTTSILKPHLQEVFPLVLDGLTAQNSEILEASLETFKVIILETPELISENLDSLVGKLLDLSTSRIVVERKLINKESIRLLSMECLLRLFSSLELQSVVKHQKIAIDQLRAGLDDNKRSVRKKASDLRQVLFELGR